MQLRETSFTQQCETDDFCPGRTQPAAEKLADTLQSQLINAFETAIDQGMQPMDALAVILSWVSSEMLRIQSDQAGRSSW